MKATATIQEIDMPRLLHHHMRQMALYAEWANQHVYAYCARHLDEIYDQNQSKPSTRVHGLLNDLLVVSKLWQSRLQGYDSGLISPEEELYEDFDLLRDAQVAEDVNTVESVNKYSEEQMKYPITYTDQQDKSHTNNITEILTEFFLQQAQIRGAIVFILGDHEKMNDLGYIRFLKSKT